MDQGQIDLLLLGVDGVLDILVHVSLGDKVGLFQKYLNQLQIAAVDQCFHTPGEHFFHIRLGFCIVNAGTDSFRKIGTSPIVIGCAVIAILALVLRVVLDKKLAIAADAMSVVAGITLVVAAVQFISPRVNTIASIMTFTNNAQTMADLSSAIYGTAALLIAVVLNIIAAFTNVNEQ